MMELLIWKEVAAFEVALPVLQKLFFRLVNYLLLVYLQI